VQAYVSNLAIVLTQTSAIGNSPVRGILFSGPASYTSCVLENVDLTVSVVGPAIGGFSNAVEFTGGGTAPKSVRNLRNVGITMTCGSGTCNLVYMNTTGTVRLWEVDASVVSAGTGNGFVTANAAAVFFAQGGSVSNTGSAAGSELLQTSGSLFPLQVLLSTWTAASGIKPIGSLLTLQWNADALGGAGTVWMTPSGAAPLGTTIGRYRIPQPMMCFYLGVFAQTTSTTAATTFQFSLGQTALDGTATPTTTALTCTFTGIAAGTATSCSDTSHGISFPNGADLAMNLVRTGGGTNPTTVVVTVQCYVAG
jgi:hypothetical protein